MSPDVVVKVIEASGDWWDLVPAVVGGIIGALAGGLPAFWLARRNSQENDRQRSEDRLQADRAKAIRVFGTLQGIVNSFFSTRMMIDQMLEKPADPADPFPIQRRVQGMVGFGQEAEYAFDSNDLSIFVSADHPEYFQQLDLLARRHAAIMSSLIDYRSEREKYNEIIRSTEHELHADGRVTSRVDRETLQQIRLQEAMLESIIGPVVDMIHENTEALIVAADQFAPITKEYLKGSGKVPAFDVSDLKEKYRISTLESARTQKA